MEGRQRPPVRADESRSLRVPQRGLAGTPGSSEGRSGSCQRNEETATSAPGLRCTTSPPVLRVGSGTAHGKRLSPLRDGHSFHGNTLSSHTETEKLQKRKGSKCHLKHREGRGGEICAAAAPPSPLFAHAPRYFHCSNSNSVLTVKLNMSGNPTPMLLGPTFTDQS